MNDIPAVNASIGVVRLVYSPKVEEHDHAHGQG
jgi:hypothetical protein